MFNIILSCAARGPDRLLAHTLPAWRKRAGGARERRRAQGATATIAGNTPAHRAVVGLAPGEQEEGATAERATHLRMREVGDPGALTAARSRGARLAAVAANQAATLRARERPSGLK